MTQNLTWLTGQKTLTKWQFLFLDYEHKMNPRLMILGSWKFPKIKLKLYEQTSREHIHVPSSIWRLVVVGLLVMLAWVACRRDKWQPWTEKKKLSTFVFFPMTPPTDGVPWRHLFFQVCNCILGLHSAGQPALAPSSWAWAHSSKAPGQGCSLRSIRQGLGPRGTVSLCLRPSARLPLGGPYEAV